MARTTKGADKTRGKGRGNGEGSIWQQESGRRYWVAEVSLGYEDGKRIRKRIYGKTRQEVATKLLAIQQQVSDGTLRPTNRDTLTVTAFMEEWLEQVQEQLRPRTMQSYRQLIRLHILPALGDLKLIEVKSFDISRFLTAKIREGKLSARSVQYLRAILHVAFNYAVDHDILDKNVVSKTKGPRVEQSEPTMFSLEQCKQLQSNFMGHRQEALFTVTLNLGLRFGEVLGLRWEDIKIDMAGDGSTLTIRNQLQKIDGTFRFAPPKSRSGRRTIPLPRFIVQALLCHRERQDIERQLAGEDWEGEKWELVFPNTLGKPQCERWVRRQFDAVLRKAGLPRIKFHHQRHQTASMLAAAGVHPRLIQMILGHATIAQTMNIYTHVLPGEAEVVASVLQNIMGEGNPSYPPTAME